MWPNGFTNSPLAPKTPMNRAPSRSVSRAVIEIARAASLVMLTVDLTPSIPGFSISASTKEMLLSESYRIPSAELILESLGMVSSINSHRLPLLNLTLACARAALAAQTGFKCHFWSGMWLSLEFYFQKS